MDQWPRTDLGDMEHLVLLAILRLGTGRLRHPDPRRSVCAERPRRLARDGLCRAEAAGTERASSTSRLGDSTPERGGRAKRFFKLKPSGLKALRESREMFLGLWRDYESVLDRA